MFMVLTLMYDMPKEVSRLLGLSRALLGGLSGSPSGVKEDSLHVSEVSSRKERTKLL